MTLDEWKSKYGTRTPILLLDALINACHRDQCWSRNTSDISVELHHILRELHEALQ